MMKNTVLCMKWGTKYGCEYVNRLYNMVLRNLTIPFEFVCFTDDSEGIDSNVKTLPLPDMPNLDKIERGWRKLCTFRNDIGLEGRILFLDLDIVIVSNIDDYFKLDGDFIVTKHWFPSKTQGVGQTSVYRFEAGMYNDLYEYFIKNIDEIRSTYRHEQAYVTTVMNKRDVLKFFPEEFMPSFKYNCMRNFPLNLFFEPKLPEEAKIVVFHGNPTPDQAMKGRTKGLIKYFYRYVKTPKWLKDNWR